MKLPIYSTQLLQKSKVLRLNGLHQSAPDQTDLTDAVNLTGVGCCKTRAARKPAMLLTKTPDQVLTLGERLFFRYENQLQEMTADDDGMLTEQGEPLILTAIDPAPDRILVLWDSRLCVLPDKLYFLQTEVTPTELGATAARKVAMPFENAQTLFYTSGYSGGTPCEEAYLLEPGMELTFSWLANQTFTIQSIDLAYSDTGTAEVFEGFRVTLDQPVSNWNAIPNNGHIYYAVATRGLLLPPIQLGRYEELYCFENQLEFYTTHEDFTFVCQNLTQLHRGQRVLLSGSGAAQNNRVLTISEVGKNYISFEETLFPITEAAGTEITLTPVVPDLIAAELLEDRLIGIDHAAGLWVSVKEQPFVFHRSPQTETEGWYCQLPDLATGMTVWKDSVLVFTETGGYRLFGSDALSYGITHLSISGLLNNASKTLCRIADTLYYNAPLGIMRYSGSSDRGISDALPLEIRGQSAATFRSAYYLLADQRLWIYHPDRGIWWSQNAETVTDLFTAFGNLYLLTPNTVYCADGGHAGFHWRLVTGNQPNEAQCAILPRQCRIKLSANPDCTLALSFRAYGSKVWQTVATRAVQDEAVLTLPLPRAKCNGFFLKLEGYGTMTVQDITLFYREV